MSNVVKTILSYCFLVGICFLICLILAGCATKTPSAQIAQTITQNAEDAKTVIFSTTSLEQCKNASVLQINALVRQANDAIAVCQAEVQSEKKDTRFWFWAFITACGVILAFVLNIIKRAVKITP